jgi:hypothetical protein
MLVRWICGCHGYVGCSGTAYASYGHDCGDEGRGSPRAVFLRRFYLALTCSTGYLGATPSCFYDRDPVKILHTLISCNTLLTGLIHPLFLYRLRALSPRLIILSSLKGSPATAAKPSDRNRTRKAPSKPYALPSSATAPAPLSSRPQRSTAASRGATAIGNLGTPQERKEIEGLVRDCWERMGWSSFRFLVGYAGMLRETC